MRDFPCTRLSGTVISPRRWLLSAMVLTTLAATTLLVGACNSAGGGRAGQGRGAGTNQPTGDDAGEPDDSANSGDVDVPGAGLPCISCHSAAMGTRRAVVDGSGGGSHTLQGNALSNDDCLVCHDLSAHQQGNVRLWLNPNTPGDVIELAGDPSKDRDEAGKLVPLCGACHGESVHGGHPVGGDWQPTCVACHNLHDPGSDNSSLIASSIYSIALGEDKPVTFTSRTGAGSFDDGDDAAHDGICQVCHTATDFHREDGTGIPHNDGADCTACHKHEDGFLPTAGDSCIACHSAPQGSRQAVVGPTGASSHHLVGNVLSDTDCEKCHDQSHHRQGNVRLWANPNDPADVIVLNGDPGSDPVEAGALTAFCSACHSTADYTIHDVPGPWQPACTACHGLHDPAGTNLSAISPLLHNLTLDTDKAVLFSALSGQGSFDDGDPANDDGICQVCHTATAFHVHDGSGMVHNDATDCTACHEHRIGFRIPEGESSCIACHSQPQGPRSAVVAPDGSGAHHLGAEPMRDSDCLKCHDMTLHREGNVRLWQNPNAPSTVIELTGQPLTDPAESDKLIPFCTSCHSSTGHSTHAVGGAWQPSCGTCHDLHNPANTNLRYISPKIFNQTLSQFQDVVLTGRTGPGSFSDGVGANDGVCQVCHTGTKFHLHDGSGASHNAGVDCTACHAHNAGFLPVDSTSCIACHSSPQGSRPAVINADGTGGHHLGTGPLVDADCAGCHDTSQHQQGVVRLWTNPANPSVAFAASGDPDQLSPFCGTCHGGLTSPTTHTTGASWEPACMECHVLHDPSNTNWSLVSESIMNQTLGQQQPVVFTARTGANSFSDGIGADDGVCQVCHTSTTYHLYDGGGASHNPGADCTACHSHDSGFIPSGSSSCVGCHSGAQGSRRAVVTEFGLASHHVADASVTDADCQVCHDQSQHQQGQVRLKNADNASTVYVLSGDPMSIASEAAVLEPFCLACHDSDAAGGAVPFSDGLTPTVIDATAWAGAVHAAGQTTCVGDGETFGCHSTGHGSVKANLLAPWNGSQPAITGDALRQEEGLCYSCHDADGPAATNVQAQFALSSHHNVSDVDQVDGSKVECIHCHNPHLASTITPLIDPDSGAAWAGTGEAFCLKCHDGTPPAGVSFPAAAPGSGYDKSAFVGSTHDTLAGADNCRQCHEQHGSANLATLKNRYVVADFNKYSTGDGDYASCWDCHNENFVIEQKNRFEGFHKKHVKGEDAPCITCHDAHRSYDAGEPGLINLTYPNQQGFDFQFIDGKDASTAFWLNAAQNQGNCYLRCHGKKHDPKDYKR